MRRNMGTLDRVLRALVVAPIALIAGLVAGAGTPLGVILIIVAAVMLATAAIGFCPLYAPFGLKTCPRKMVH